jgi:hypothetical protein
VSNLVDSDLLQDDEEEEEDEKDSELGMLSDYEEPGWEMGTITKTVQHCMESFQQKQIRLDELTQPRCRDRMNYFCQRDLGYRTAELKVLAVVEPQMDMIAATQCLTTFEELIQTPDIVLAQSQMTAVTSRPGSREMMLGLEKLQSHKVIPIWSCNVAPDSTTIQDVMPVQIGSV